MSRYMNLLTDFAFKRIFGSEENKGILIKFLNTIVDAEDRIIDVTFRDKEALPFYEDGKRMVYDIYCLTHDERHVIIEMQQYPHPTFPERTLMYCSHALLRQGVIGKSYELKSVYGIFIMNFSLPGYTPKLVRKTGICDLDTGEEFLDKLKMIYLDLSEMSRESINECVTPAEEWLYLIKNMGKIDKKPEGYQEYAELFDAADISSLSAEDVVPYSQSLRKLNDDREGMLYFGEQEKLKGIEMGRQEGRQEGERNILTKLAAKFKKEGMSLENIAKLLGSDTEMIKSLLNGM